MGRRRGPDAVGRRWTHAVGMSVHPRRANGPVRYRHSTRTARNARHLDATAGRTNRSEMRAAGRAGSPRTSPRGPAAPTRARRDDRDVTTARPPRVPLLDGDGWIGWSSVQQPGSSQPPGVQSSTAEDIDISSPLPPTRRTEPSSTSVAVALVRPEARLGPALHRVDRTAVACQCSFRARRNGGIVTGKRLEPTLGFEPRTCCLRSRSA